MRIKEGIEEVIAAVKEGGPPPANAGNGRPLRLPEIGLQDGFWSALNRTRASLASASN